MNLIIKSWSGRMGNNIIQLINALKFSIYYKINLIYPKHKCLKTTKLIFSSSNEDNIDINIYDKKNFTRISDIEFDNKLLKKNNIKIDINTIKKKFQNFHEIKMNLNKIFLIQSKTQLKEDVLVIYIRTGDLFDEMNVHPKYISAPLYYYETIINNYKSKYKKYILVAEDTKNPVIKELLKKYPFIEHKINCLKDDLEIILSASHIVSCIGTFVTSLSWISNNMKKVYLPDFVGKRNYFPTIEVEKINLNSEKNNYINSMGNWKNTKIQRKLLLNYKP